MKNQELNLFIFWSSDHTFLLNYMATTAKKFRLAEVLQVQR